jgi:aspartokinase/homoserine dehydrogenase 1
MKVLKFGGTSVGSPEMIRRVSRIIDSHEGPLVVVVSAFSGVTDELGRIHELALSGDIAYKKSLEVLIDRHLSDAGNLIRDHLILDTVSTYIDQICEELKRVLVSVSDGTADRKISINYVSGAGELLSSYIIASYLPGAGWYDSREFIKTHGGTGDKYVDLSTTYSLIRHQLGKASMRTVVPGFIASGPEGISTTLGRGGSDYTAALVAAALGAEVLEIWTDVNGFMSADPKKVEKAYTIDSLSYAEAMELSHFGAKVIYTPTLRPVYKQKIPVHVRNTNNPDLPGTLIEQAPGNGGRSPIKGISSIDHIDLITLQGPSMVGITGTAARLFGALARNEVNVILITQASSEFSISFAVIPSASEKAIHSIREEFQREIKEEGELNITIEKNLSIIAIVGEKMKNTPGISATLFRALGRNGINVVATAQGSSELNISVVIKNESLGRALNVIHDGFFLSAYKELNLFIAGTGLVGTGLLKQLQKQIDLLEREYKLRINLTGITNSRKMISDKKGIPLDKYREHLRDSGEKSDIGSFVGKMSKMNLRNSVFVDCTADAGVASYYVEVLESYISVVTANKIACSSDYSYYSRLRNLAGERGIRFMYETTVGAGLPIIKTISELMLSGDRILKIEAVLSGTLNFIFNEIGPDMPLSQAIRKAREKGYSEPDPRVDLSGTDVVRKILILSREAGYKLEQKDVEVEKFIPDDFFKGSLEDFYSKVETLDKDFEERRKRLVHENKKWRFFATLDKGRAKVHLLTVDPGHPSFHLEGSNNIVLLTTERYRELPMVIKGYGAGADVTAAGVFADLMRVVNV